MSEENFPTYNFQIDLSKLLIHSGSPSPLYDEGCGNRGQPNSPPPTSDAGGDKIKSLVDLSYSLPSPASFLSKSQCQNATSINSKDRKANSASVTTSTTTNSPMASDCDQPIFLYNTLPPSFNNKMQQSTFDKSFLSEEAKQAAANIKDTMAVIAGRRQMFFEEPSHPVSFCSPSRTLPASSSSSSSSLKHQSNNISASLRGSLASNTNSSTTVATTTSTSVPSPLAAPMHQSPADCKSSTRLSLKNVDLMKNCPPLEIYTTSPVLSPTKRNFSPSFYSPPPNSSSPTTTSQQVIFHFQENSSTAKSIGTSTTGGNTNSNFKSNNNSHMARQEVSTQRFEHCHLNTEVLSHYRPVSEDVPRHELVTCNHNADKVLKDSDEVVHFHSAPEPIIANSCLILSSDALLEEDVESAPSTPKTLQTLSASMKGSSKPNKFFPDSPITLTSDLGDGHAIIATGEELASLDCDSKKSSESKRASSKTEKKTKKGTSRLTQTVTHTSTNTSTQTFTHTSSGKNSPLSKHKKSPSSKDSNQKESWKGRMARTIKRYGSSSILLNNDADTKAHKGVFGAPLDTLQPSTADPLVPLIVEVCVKIIEEKGLDNQGLYRVPGNTGALKELQEDIDKDEKGLCVESDKWQDVNLVTSLLKLFFRKIPDPLITDDLYNAVIESTRVEKSERRMLKLKKLLHELPERNFNTFRYICKHLSLVSRHEENNKMDAHNLAIMFGPTLIRPHDNNIAVMARNMADQCRIVETIISNCDWFFSSWDEDVNVPDDGSGDINNAIDESMVAKAQNLALYTPTY